MPAATSSSGGAKYVPPAMRKKLAEEAAAKQAAAAGGYTSCQSSSTAARTASAETVEGLLEWLRRVRLEHRHSEVLEWCHREGAVFLEEVAEHSTEIAEALCLEPLEADRFCAEARHALAAVMSGSEGSPGASPGNSRSSALSLRTASIGLGDLVADSSSEAATTAAASAPALAKKSCSITKALMITAAVKKFRRANSAVSSAPSTIHEEEAGAENEEKAPPDRADSGPPPDSCQSHGTATINSEGPLACLFGTTQIKHKTLSISEVLRCDAYRSRAARPEALSEEELADTLGPLDRGALKKPSPAEPSTKSPGGSRLVHTDTVGNFSEMGQQRSRLQSQIMEDKAKPVSLDHGQTGTVYALEAGGEKIAVFKPTDGEKFSRKSLDVGMGAVREEAVYLVDRLCGSQAKVPVTSRASIEVDGNTLHGSVQAFVIDVLGFIEDFAMPRDLEKAIEFVPQKEAEALALLDMRVFNMDRHSGNLLLLRREKPHSLGPIDHGCCLPPWWCLGEAIFDAWISWPQLQTPPCEATREAARQAREKLQQTCEMVTDAGLDASGVVTLQLCTLFVFVGVAELGLPLGQLAALMLRDEETGLAELSWLEQRVLQAAQAAGEGAGCRMQENQRGDQELVVEGSGEGLEVATFLSALETTFREDLPKAVAAATPTAGLASKNW